MRTRIKICGITNLADAQSAVLAGADALGFMFYERSSRNIQPALAAEIAAKIPPFVSKVGVFVDAPVVTILQTAALCGLDAIQLHGAETPEFCSQLRPLKVYKAFRVKDESTLDQLRAYDVSAWLLDSYVAGQAGGTGERFNWELAVRAVGFGKPVILAGGLHPGNVAAAIKQVRAYALDVSSGVEKDAPGIKDAEKIRAFVNAAREADLACSCRGD